MRSVAYSDIARQNLEDIFWHIHRDNPAAAVRVVNRILSSMEALASYSTGRPGRVAGTFEKVVTGLPYVATY